MMPFSQIPLFLSSGYVLTRIGEGARNTSSIGTPEYVTHQAFHESRFIRRLAALNVLLQQYKSIRMRP